MLSLRELQERAYRAIVLDEDGILAPPGAQTWRSSGLEVYRNNARETFHKTLAATYPVVRRLVGDLCFRGLARSYVREFPSRTGDLAHYGAELPTLLEIHYRDSPFAYLADVARLEWACAEVESAADSLPFDVLDLARVAPAECATLRFALRSAVRLLSSRYPIFAIWEANQAQDVRPVALAAGGEHVLVTRARGRGIELYRLDAGTFAFARSLADGESLADACDAGAGAAEGFAPAAALETLAHLGVLAGFRLPADEVE